MGVILHLFSIKQQAILCMLFNFFLLLFSVFDFIRFGRKLCAEISMKLLENFGNLNAIVLGAEQKLSNWEPRLKYYIPKLLVVVLFVTRGTILALRV